MERKEVTIYAMTVDDSRSVPIQAFDNGDGTFSLRMSQGDSVSQKVSFTDHSGTTSDASVSQQVMPANLNRRYLIIQNVSTGALWINFNTDADEDQPSLKLVADGSFAMEGSAIVTDSISIIGSAAAQQFTAKEG